MEPQKHFGRALPRMEHVRAPQHTLDRIDTSLDVPQDIRDLQTIVATINIPDSINVEDVDVGITITHNWVRDLTIWLERDSVYFDTIEYRDTIQTDTGFVLHDTFWVDIVDSVASAVLLDLFPGDSIVNMTDCWFDDDAGRSIYEGLPPFTGGYRPLRSIDSLFAGHSAAGQWRLYVRDRYTRDEGVLESFQLEINGIASLVGTVRNAETNSPVVNATILVIDTTLFDSTQADSTGFDTLAHGTTLTNGTYRFSRLDPGNYRIEAKATNYDSAFVDGVVIVDGATTTQDFALIPQISFTDISYTGPSVPIPDLSRVVVPLEVSSLLDSVLILDLDLTVNISHTYIADLFIALQHPNLDSITMFDPPLQPSLDSHMVNCRFDDEATTSITQGRGPFTGSFRPVAPLSGFDSLEADGTWNLIVQDYAEGDIGTVQSFTLHIETELLDAEDDRNAILPESFKLHPAYPNPFNPSANFTLDVVRTQDIELQVFDITGRLVETLHSGRLNAGSHHFIWSPLTAASGMYFVRAHSTDLSQTIKLVLLK